MGTPLGPKYIPYTYMDPLGKPARPRIPLANAPSQGPHALKSNVWNVSSECYKIQ